MTSPNDSEGATRGLYSRPALECDVVLKGGITSGVIYPRALTEFAKTYRFRGVGGASAGAIGAAFAAAAELGRDRGGFEKLHEVPGQLGDGALLRLFAPQPSTRALLPIVLAIAGGDGSTSSRPVASRVVSVTGALLRGFPLAATIGALPGLGLGVAAVAAGGWPGIVLGVLAVVALVLGIATGVVLRTARSLTRDVPANLFGICRGLGDERSPALTDWITTTLDDLADTERAAPLTFGDLWGDGDERLIDLRMISTCLSRSRPYEMPWDAHNFFYDPVTWATIFPERVMRALAAAPSDAPPDASEGAAATWRRENAAAAAAIPSLVRLPAAQYLPAVVATRMSLSFPLLISAVPLWSLDSRSTTAKGYAGFEKLWFSDGGLCSSFPLHMFDAPLPTRPTFAINLGSIDERRDRDDSGAEPFPREYIDFARTNSDGLLPPHRPIPETGLASITGFASAAFTTSRSWQDNSYLDVPGYRDRIVRVLQSADEGGLNLTMSSQTIERLANRGGEAARLLTEQFVEPRYRVGETPTPTGWDNHRWVRFRALVTCLPDFLSAYRRGLAALEVDGSRPPSYSLSGEALDVAHEIADGLDDVAATVEAAPDDRVSELTGTPRPSGTLRRVSQI